MTVAIDRISSFTDSQGTVQTAHLKNGTGPVTECRICRFKNGRGIMPTSPDMPACSTFLNSDTALFVSTREFSREQIGIMAPCHPKKFPEP